MTKGYEGGMHDPPPLVHPTSRLGSATASRGQVAFIGSCGSASCVLMACKAVREAAGQTVSMNKSHVQKHTQERPKVRN